MCPFNTTLRNKEFDLPRVTTTTNGNHSATQAPNGTYYCERNVFTFSSFRKRIAKLNHNAMLSDGHCKKTAFYVMRNGHLKNVM